MSEQPLPLSPDNDINLFYDLPLAMGGNVRIIEQSHSTATRPALYPRDAIDFQVKQYKPGVLLLEHLSPSDEVSVMEDERRLDPDVQHQFLLASELGIPMMLTDYMRVKDGGIPGTLQMATHLEDDAYHGRLDKSRKVIADSISEANSPIGQLGILSLLYGISYVAMNKLLPRGNDTLHLRRELIKHGTSLVTTLVATNQIPTLAVLAGKLLVRPTDELIDDVEKLYGAIGLVRVPGFSSSYGIENYIRIRDGIINLVGVNPEQFPVTLDLRNAKLMESAEAASWFLKLEKEVENPKVALVLGYSHSGSLKSGRYASKESRKSLISHIIATSFINAFEEQLRLADKSGIKKEDVEDLASWDLTILTLANSVNRSQETNTGYKLKHYIILKNIEDAIEDTLGQNPLMSEVSRRYKNIMRDVRANPADHCLEFPPK